MGLGAGVGSATSGGGRAAPPNYDLVGNGLASTLSSGARLGLGRSFALNGTLAAFWAPRTELVAGSEDAVVAEPDRNVLVTYLGLGATGFFAYDISAQGSLGALFWGTEGTSDLSYRLPGFHGSVAKEWRVSDALAVGVALDLLVGVSAHAGDAGGNLGLLLTATHF